MDPLLPKQMRYQAALHAEVLKLGAGEGNRTLVFSLEGCGSTIELHPQSGLSVRFRTATVSFGETTFTSTTIPVPGKGDVL